MWLVLDIGNSAIKGGLYEHEQLQRTFRVVTADDHDWPTTLSEELACESIERVGVTSVVPAATNALQALLRRRPSPLPLLVVTPRLHLPFELAYATPATLGTDRLAAAAAAWTHHRVEGRPVVALDAGTAVTYEVIDHQGVYRGGAIGPGPDLLRRALHTGTAQLPEVPLEYPVPSIGTSTHTAIQSGVMHGFVDGVQGMLHRLGATLDADPVVVATGGWSPLLAEHVGAIDVTTPHLVLEGIRTLMALNP